MKRLILVGAGHAHAQVLLDWARQPVPGVELVVVGPQALAPYSGMVPGWLAGAYRFDEIVIDFPRLCQAAGARWLETELQALDPDRREVTLSSGENIGYDWLSLNVGSTLRPPTGTTAPVLSMRPLSDLRQAYGELLQQWSTSGQRQQPYRVTVVGGGAAGFESALAVVAHLRSLRPDQPVQGRLLNRGTRLLPGVSAPARRAAERALARAQITVDLNQTWTDALSQRSDLVLWATGAQAHEWQLSPRRRGSLAVNSEGFVRIDAQLRSVSHANIFAVGDCAHWDSGPTPLPKAGVYAVRMGPVLLKNLRAAVAGQAPGRYEPQRQFLVLLATADGRAIASRGPLGAAGSWAWRWKDHIDRQFLKRFEPVS